MRRLARPLLYLGIVGVVLALSKYHAAVIGEYDLSETGRLVWIAMYVSVLAVAAYGIGLPELPRTPRAALLSASGAVAAGAGLASFVQLIAGDALLPRFVVFGASLLLVPWYLLMVALVMRTRSAAEERDRVVLVCSDPDRRELESELAGNPERPAQIVGWITPSQAVEIDGRAKPVVEAVIAASASLVVLDREAQQADEIVGQVAALHERGVRVRTLSMFYEEYLGKLPLAELERVSLMFDIGEIHRLRYSRMTRLIDLVLASLGLVALAVVVPIVVVGDLAGNRGPLFYRQPRVGRDNRPFNIVKFRTMRALPDGQASNEWTTEDDPRITPFGGLLRKTHLDELPQLFNILKGDLSLVGPRPEQPHYVTELSRKLPFYDLRHLVRPGLTGWAQVKHGYAGDERDALVKLQYEFWYLRHQGVVLDLRIIGRTIRSVIGSEGGGR